MKVKIEFEGDYTHDAENLECIMNARAYQNIIEDVVTEILYRKKASITVEEDIFLDKLLENLTCI